MTRGECATTILSRRHDLAAKVAARLGIDPSSGATELDGCRIDEDLETLLRHLAESVARGRTAPLASYVSWASSRRDVVHGADRRLVRMLGVAADVVESCLPTCCGAKARAPLDEVLVLAASECTASAAESLPADADGYLESLLGGDLDLARDLATGYMERSRSLTATLDRFFRPALRAVGARWQAGRVDVAEAHRVVVSTEHLMARMRDAAGERAGAPAGEIVLCTPRGELHEIGVRMLADALASEGWNARHLGACCPAARILGELRLHRPTVLAVSVSLDSNVEPLRRLIGDVKRDPHVAGTSILVGGLVFERDRDLWREIGADAAAEDLASAIEACARLAAAPVGDTELVAK